MISRQEEYEQAYLETLSLRRQGIFWEPLCQAATFGMLGKLEEVDMGWLN
jgi:hypothetical protein